VWPNGRRPDAERHDRQSQPPGSAPRRLPGGSSSGRLEMNGTQTTSTSFFNDIPHPELAPAESPRRLATSFVHPDEVVSGFRLTQAEKREILASWASDVRAVPDAPALRQLDNGAIVRVHDALRALKSLNNGENPEHTTFDPFRTFAGLRIRLPTRLKSVLRRSWPDDDVSSPCPAMIVGPLGGPLSGGEAVDLGLALAA